MTNKYKDWKSEIDGIKVDPPLDKIPDVEDLIEKLKGLRKSSNEIVALSDIKGNVVKIDPEVEPNDTERLKGKLLKDNEEKAKTSSSIDEIEELEEEEPPFVGEVTPDELEVKSEDDILDEIAQFIVDNPDYTEDELRELADRVSIDFDDLKEMLSPERLEKARRYGHPRTEEERRERHARLHPGEALPERGTGRLALTGSDGSVIKWFENQREMNDYMRRFTQYTHAVPFGPGGLVWMIESISIDKNDTDSLSKLESVDSYDDWKTVISTIKKVQNPSVDLLFSNTTTLRLGLGDALDLQRGNKLVGIQDEKFDLMEVELLEKGFEDLVSEFRGPGAIVIGRSLSGSGTDDPNLVRISFAADYGRYEVYGIGKSLMELDIYGTKIMKRGIYSIASGDPSNLSYSAGLV